MEKRSEFFELLLLNSKSELKNWLLDKGKKPKSICPIVFKVNEVEKNMSIDSGKNNEVLL